MSFTTEAPEVVPNTNKIHHSHSVVCVSTCRCLCPYTFICMLLCIFGYIFPCYLFHMDYLFYVGAQVDDSKAAKPSMKVKYSCHHFYYRNFFFGFGHLSTPPYMVPQTILFQASVARNILMPFVILSM